MNQRPGRISFSVKNSIAEIPRADFDRLFESGLIEGYDYQKTLEESGMRGFSFGWLSACRDQELTALIPFFIMDFCADTLMPPVLHKLTHKFSRFLKVKILFLGSPTTEEFHLGISDGESLEEVIDAALNTLNDLTRRERVQFVSFYNLSRKNASLAEILRKRNFIKMNGLPGTIIKIEAGSLEDYIKGLSRNMRRDLRRKLKRSAVQAQLTTHVRQDIDGIEDDVYRLYLNNFDESGVRFEVLTKAFFSGVFKNMPQDARLFTTYDGDKLVAFNLCLAKNGFCVDKFIGLDMSVALKYHLYFTTFCHNIEWCIKNGYRYYQPGATDYHPKLRLGAKLIPLFIYTKSKNPILHLILKIIAPLIKPENIDTSWKSAGRTAQIAAEV